MTRLMGMVTAIIDPRRVFRIVFDMERLNYGAGGLVCVCKTVSVCFQSEEDGSRTEGDGIGMNMIIADNDLADGCPYGG